MKEHHNPTIMKEHHIRYSYSQGTLYILVLDNVGIHTKIYSQNSFSVTSIINPQLNHHRIMDPLTCLLRSGDHLQNLPFYERGVRSNEPAWFDIPSLDFLESSCARFDTDRLVPQVVKACEDYGMFQVENGVFDTITQAAGRAARRFFGLPSEQLYAFTKTQPEKCMLYSSSLAHSRGKETSLYWRDILTLGLDNSPILDGWPTQPSKFREEIWSFASGARCLKQKLINLISEGLGFRGDFFNELTCCSSLNIYQYPVCPYPSLALGSPMHADPNFLTITFQDDVPGLEIFLNDKWRLVPYRRDVVLVTVGLQLEIISNGRFKAAQHRVVVNSEYPRTSISYIIAPPLDCLVSPPKKILNPRYNSFYYEEFVKTYDEHNGNKEPILRKFMK